MLAVRVTVPLEAVTVIVVVPDATAVNNPALVIVPTDSLLLDHDNVALIGALFWSRVVAVNCFVLPGRTFGFNGEIVTVVRTGAAVGADTIAVAVPVIVPLPLPPPVAVMVAVPAPTAVNKPPLSIVPILLSLLVHTTDALIGLPNRSSVALVKSCVSGTVSDAVAGVTVMVASGGPMVTKAA